MKTINLPNGFSALVDDEDYKYCSRYKWYLHKSRHTSYVARKLSRGIVCFMHREIMLLKPGDGMNVHHLNNDSLDNRKENLCILSIKEHVSIHLPSKCAYVYRPNLRINKCGYTGLKETDYGWDVYYSYNNKKLYLGSFKNKLEGALAYNRKALELRGNEAVLNCVG